MKRLLQSAWVAPMDAPPLRDAALLIDDATILHVGDAPPMRDAHPDAAFEHAGHCVLLPGLINPHTHLELSDCRRNSFSGSFSDWLLNLRARDTSPGDAVQLGIDECLHFGVTTVGDISQQCRITRAALARSPLRCVSFGETLGLGKLRRRFDQLLDEAIDESSATAKLRVGLSPHAPYTVDRPGYERCVQTARSRNIPLATHLAETSHERPFLEHHAGEFRALWDLLGQWQDSVETFRGGPIEFADAIGLLALHALLAHVNYCDDDDLARLSRGRASVVYCPRTHAYFGHPPHRWRDMLHLGINLAVGTDSRASSPDLNPLAELRLLRRLAPEIVPMTLWELITTRAAAALGQNDRAGSLAPGKAADIVAFPIATDDPLGELLENDATPTRLWIDGEPIDLTSPRPAPTDARD